MNRAHILNIRKTKFILMLSVIIAFILNMIITTVENSIYEFKTLLSFLMPGVLAMLAIYITGIAIIIGILRIDFVKKFSPKNRCNIKRIIDTFNYASKTAAVLFIMMLLAYLLLTINFPIGWGKYRIISVSFGFVIIYTLLFLIQFTVYLVSLIIKIYDISLYE